MFSPELKTFSCLAPQGRGALAAQRETRNAGVEAVDAGLEGSDA